MPTFEDHILCLANMETNFEKAGHSRIRLIARIPTTFLGLIKFNHRRRFLPIKAAPPKSCTIDKWEAALSQCTFLQSIKQIKLQVRKALINLRAVM